MEYLHNALVALHFVPLAMVNGKRVLRGHEQTHIPDNLVAPDDRLHSMYTSWIYIAIVSLILVNIKWPIVHLYWLKHDNVRIEQILQ